MGYDDDNMVAYEMFMDKFEKKAAKEFPGYDFYVEGSWQNGIGSDFIFITPPEEGQEEFEKAKEEADIYALDMQGDITYYSVNDVINLIKEYFMSLNFDYKKYCKA